MSHFIWVLFALMCISAATFAAEITGTVREVSGDSVVIASDAPAAAGDKVELYFEIPGIDDLVHVGSGQVTGVDNGRITARIEQKTGALAIGQIAKIQASGKPIATESAAPVVPPQPQSTGTPADLAFWDAIKDSTDPGDFEDYLKQFPNGTFAALVQRRLKALKEPQKKLREDRASQKKPATASGGENYLEKGHASQKAKNYTEAIKWFRKAAEQGNADAQNSLGINYYHGQGVKRDYVQAVHWIRKAAEQGSAEPQTYLGLLYAKGEGVAQDYREAVKWFRKAAEQGYAVAQSNLSISYRNGQGVARDYREAVKWIRKAAEQGHAVAQNDLGLAYQNGQGVPLDYREAVKWFRKAGEQGDSGAQYNMGLAYAYGEGAPKDYTEAVKWLRKASDQGDQDAKAELRRLGER